MHILTFTDHCLDFLEKLQSHHERSAHWHVTLESIFTKWTLWKKHNCAKTELHIYIRFHGNDSWTFATKQIMQTVITNRWLDKTTCHFPWSKTLHICSSCQKRVCKPCPVPIVSFKLLVIVHVEHCPFMQQVALSTLNWCRTNQLCWNIATRMDPFLTALIKDFVLIWLEEHGRKDGVVW